MDCNQPTREVGASVLVARPEDLIRCSPKFNREGTDPGSNGRNGAYRVGPTMACSHDAYLVLETSCQHNDFSSDAEQNADHGEPSHQSAFLQFKARASPAGFLRSR
jgi:hypothetical protein